MENLFRRQTSFYAAAMPRYPPQLFQLLASLTECHKRAWDVGTGNGQAAVGIAEYYDDVIATDVSKEQLRLSEQRPNISYRTTSAGPLSTEEVDRVVGGEGSLDLITVAQAVHWFDLPYFYAHARRLLRNPGGIIAVWCYTLPQVSAEVDSLLNTVYTSSLPYWEPNVELVMDGYHTLHFPFKPVLEGEPKSNPNPIRMDATKNGTLVDYLGFLESWSATNTARAKGVELLGVEVKSSFEHAWGSPSLVRTITFPLYARIGSPF